MPKMPPGGLIGLHVTGDLNGITYVQRAGQRRTAYVKTYPKRTHTAPKQRAIDNFKAAVQAWRDLDEAHKQCLRDIEKRFRLSTYGRNVFIGCHVGQRLDIIQKWASQIGFGW